MIERKRLLLSVIFAVIASSIIAFAISSEFEGKATAPLKIFLNSGKAGFLVAVVFDIKFSKPDILLPIFVGICTVIISYIRGAYIANFAMLIVDSCVVVLGFSAGIGLKIGLRKLREYIV